MHRVERPVDRDGKTQLRRTTTGSLHPEVESSDNTHTDGAIADQTCGGQPCSPRPCCCRPRRRLPPQQPALPDAGRRSTVERTPEAVVLTFDESTITLGAQIVVSGPSGPVQSGSPSVVDNSVWQVLAAGAPAGSYTVACRVTSEDLHPITGSFRFTAQAAGGGQAPLPSGPPVSAQQSAGPLARRPLLLAVAIAIIAGVGALRWCRTRRTQAQPRLRSGPD